MTRTILPLAVLPARVRSRIEPDDSGCWIWTDGSSSKYARFMLNWKTHTAHRYVYEQLVGAIPEGLVIDHLCRVPRCVNPEHLEPVTHTENIRRGLTHALKTHCPQGHPWIAENMYWKVDGKPRCAVCRRERYTADAHRIAPRRQTPAQCKHGHDYTPENTYWSRNGSFHCRACKHARDARKRAT